MAIDTARAWVEIDVSALRANYDTLQRSAGEAVLVPMVKADAYGLGAVRVVRALSSRDPWGWGVATAEEGRQLREAGVTRPILVAGPLPPGAVPVAAAAGLTPALSSLEELDAWAAAAGGDSPLDFHVEVDTGMGRSGFDWRELEAWAPEVAARTGPELRWTGVFTHFHSGDVEDRGPTQEQWERFQAGLVQLPVPRDSLMVHAAASGVALRWPEYAADAVRPGLFLYGGQPVTGVEGVMEPEPVVSVRARLSLLKTVPAGSTVGYEATYTAAGPERWGTVAIGYGDGLPRALSNRGHALVRGRKVPIIGRISMDLTTVRLDDVPGAEPGDVATLVGRDGEESITLEQVAEEAGTIGYEVLTGLGPRLPRLEREQEAGSETE